MAFIKKTLNKAYLGSSAPSPKDPNILIYAVDDVETWPTRDDNGILSASASALALKATSKGIGIYVIPSTLTRNDSQEGDAPATGWIANVAGEVPGDELALNEMIQHLTNKDLVIITKGCEGENETRLHGAKCAPMQLSVEETDSNEKTSKTITFKQSPRYKYKSMHYTGTIPAVETAATPEDPDGA